MHSKLLAAVATIALVAVAGYARAADGPVKVGVLTDMSGLYADIGALREKASFSSSFVRMLISRTPISPASFFADSTSSEG